MVNQALSRRGAVKVSVVPNFRDLFTLVDPDLYSINHFLSAGRTRLSSAS